MINAICINAGSKPALIPMTHWLKVGQEYKVIMIYNMVKQEGILGVVLQGMDLEKLDCGYSSYKIDRFGFRPEDMEDLVRLAKNCAELNDFNVEELLQEQLEVI